MYYVILHHRSPFLSRPGREEMGDHQKMDFTRRSSITARVTEPCQRSTPNGKQDQDTNNTGSPTQNRTRHPEAPNPHTKIDTNYRLQYCDYDDGGGIMGTSVRSDSQDNWYRPSSAHLHQELTNAAEPSITRRTSTNTKISTNTKNLNQH